jgi:hypothetical protein
MVVLLVLSAQVSIPSGITFVGTSYQRVETEVHVPHVKMQSKGATLASRPM